VWLCLWQTDRRAVVCCLPHGSTPPPAHAQRIPISLKTTSSSLRSSGRRWDVFWRTQGRQKLVHGCGTRSLRERESSLVLWRHRNYGSLRVATTRIGDSWIYHPLGHRRWFFWHKVCLFRHSLPDVSCAHGETRYPRNNKKPTDTSGIGFACSCENPAPEN